MPIYVSDHLVNACCMGWDLRRIRMRSLIREMSWTAKARRHKRQDGTPLSIPDTWGAVSFQDSPGCFCYTLPDQTKACSGHEELCAVWLCCRSQRQYCVCKNILLSLGFCRVSVFAQSCGGQNRHLFRNGVAGESDWWRKKTRPDRY